MTTLLAARAGRRLEIARGRSRRSPSLGGRAAAVVAVVLAAAGLAACGATGQARSGSSTQARAEAAASARATQTATLRSTLLTLGDLPSGWRRTAHPVTGATQSRAFVKQLAACTGIPAPEPNRSAAFVQSPVFRLESYAISSSAAPASPSARAFERKLLHEASASYCYGASLDKVLRPDLPAGVELRPVNALVLPPDAHQPDSVVINYRVIVEQIIKGRSVDSRIDSVTLESPTVTAQGEAVTGPLPIPDAAAGAAIDAVARRVEATG